MGVRINRFERNPGRDNVVKARPLKRRKMPRYMG